MRFARYNLMRLLPSGVYLASLLVLWALDAVSVASLVWASWLGTAVTALLRLYHSRDVLGARPSLSEARRLVAFGARLHGAALLAALLAQADRLVVITFWDEASLGLYVVALSPRDRRTERRHRRLQHAAPAATRRGRERRSTTADHGPDPALCLRCC